MKSLCLLLLLSALVPAASQAQDPAFLHVEVTMEAHGFMCPFLTPMFLGFVEEKGALWVHHDPDASVVSFAMPMDSVSSAEEFTERLVLIGYEQKQIGFARFDTTATLPTPPMP
ncbi:hypothetical protein N9C70_02520 [Flavobacteriales bacterium]|nr:hypothetical protein [Flavobacteriales bacterium]